MNSDKSGFLRHFSSDFEQFRAILSNFKALLDVSSFALNTHIQDWLTLGVSLDQIWDDLELSVKP